MAQDNYQKHIDKGDVIKDLIQKYLSKWYWFALGLIIALTAAYLHLRYTPKVYRSEAKIFILDQNKGIDLSSQMFQSSRVNLNKEIEILNSYPIIKRVVKNQDLTVRFLDEGSLKTTEVNSLPFGFSKTIADENITSYSRYRLEVTKDGFKVYKSGSENAIAFPDFSTRDIKHNLPFELNLSYKSISKDLIGKKYVIKFAPVSAVTKRLQGAIRVSISGKNTGILSLKHASQSKAKNERILNELISVFNQDGIDDRRETSKRTLEFINARFESLASELDSLETNIKEFKQNNQMLSVESGASGDMTKLTTAKKKQFELENQLMLVDLLKESLQTNDSGPDLLPANVGVSSGNVNSLISKYNDLVLEAQKYETSAGRNNPRLLTLKEKLRELKSNIFLSIETLKTQLEAKKSKVEKKISRFTAEVYSIPAKEKTFLNIKRKQEIKQELYIYLLEKREEAAVNYAVTEPTIKVIENALSSGGAISPNSKSIYTKAVIAGLGIPFALIYLFLLLDTKLKNRENIELVTNKIPVVAELPKAEKKNQLICLDYNDSSKYAEAYRMMIYKLNYTLPVKETKKANVVYVTSSIKGEGKTYVSLNLSLALSSLNKKVLLIGADLRNPQIHNYLGFNKTQEGLSSYLYDTEFDWKKSLIKGFDQYQNHDILFSGNIPPNPASLLTNGRLEKLLDEAKEEYDYIILDSAPTILVSDTMLTASLADVTVYVTRANFTEKKLLNYAKDLSDTNKIKNMVFVINDLDRKSNSYGYGYNYGYGYGYGA